MEEWGSTSISWLAETTSSRPLVSALFGTVLAYLLWAFVDQWVVHRGRKGPVQWPILGATVEVLRNFQTLQDWAVFYFLRDGLTFSCQMPNMNMIYTADPANVEYILKTNFANYPKGKVFREIFHTFLGDGIFNVDGESWKLQRKTASYEFASRNLREFSTVVFRDYSVKVASIINTNACMTQQPLDMQDLFMRFTLDSSFKIAFGYEIDSLRPELPNLPFTEAFDFTHEVSSRRFFNPFWKLQRALKVGDEGAMEASAKKVNEFLYSVIQAKKCRGEDTLGKSDLFFRFMTLNKNGGEHQLTDTNFRDALLNLVMAARDTTASTLSWFTYMMIMHPHVADKVFEELRVFESESQAANFTHGKNEAETRRSGEDNFDEKVSRFSELLTFDSLLKLHYLHACILETLRLYPAVPMNAKSTVSDDVFPDGTIVKEGDIVLYAPYAMGRMPSLWGPDATEFKPERWLVNGVVQLESPFKFTAFQAGPRICLGRDSAMLNLRMCLAILCRFFKFHLEPSCVVRYRQMAILVLANGLDVKITKRCD